MPDQLTFVEPGDEVVLLGVLEGELEGVEHDPAELLDVVLLPGLAAVPAERHGQLRGLHRRTVGRLPAGREGGDCMGNRTKCRMTKSKDRKSNAKSQNG